jgi:tetratricopeptide (TPR) repeat protein
VQDLVAEMIGKPYDRDLPATLYELLMPNRLKEQAYETADLQLVLDSDAAEYPWEMLAERGQDNVPRPLATRMGMIRQLEMQQPRERIESPHDNNALVIGEPDLGGNPLFPPLPKAKEEAEVVAGLLRRQGYDVLSLIGPDAKTNAILDAFFRKDYRIIHIAGHGAYKRGDPRSTGVVIGDNRYLTAATIQQLRVVPDLVFLNCCYLARTDAGGAALPAPGQAQPAWNLLAASVSEALIRIGVRAVVAAGWAVKDEAAQFFAKEFYRLMLSDAGYGFGKAVYEARRNVLAHPDFGATTNTWGAYQCYGDPGFTLRRQARRADSAPQEPVAAHEVIRELREIERNARRLTTDDPEARRVYLERARLLARTTPRDWRNGEMLYGLAAAFGELGEFEEAIEYYREAIESPSFQEQVPLAAVEQLANLKARYADKLRRGIEDRRKAGQPDAEQDAADDAMRKALLDDAIERLEQLLKVAETPERLALMGGCYKRAFTAARGAERNVAFRKGKEWYQRAHSKSLEGGKLNPYHTLNWVAFRTFQRSSSRLATRRELLDLIGRSERVVLAQPAPQRGFWDRVNLPDAAVLRALIEGNLEQRQKQILGLYREAFRQGVSSRQRNSMLQQFDFLIAAADWRDQAALAGSLRRLRDALAG